MAAATPLREPDQHFAYVSGDPRKVELDDLLFLNDTPYNMTGFSLRIIGTGTDTDDPGTIVLDDTVDAVFGDVAGHPISSDIFQQIEITENGKAIHFRDCSNHVFFLLNSVPNHAFTPGFRSSYGCEMHTCNTTWLIPSV